MGAKKERFPRVSLSRAPFFPAPITSKSLITVEPRYNEPPYNEVLSMTNDFLYPINSKKEKDLDITKPRYSETFCQSLGPS